jgi:hypothetical protein
MLRHLLRSKKAIVGGTISRFDRVVNKIDIAVTKKVQLSNVNREKRVDALVTKMIPYIENNKDNEVVQKADESMVNLYHKFKIFMKEYGPTGLGVYWTIWGSATVSSYFLFKYGIIDYHSWSWLHLDSMELAIQDKMKKWFDKDIVMDKQYEDIIAAILMGKITKPAQWVAVYYITPPIAALIKKTSSKKEV